MIRVALAQINTTVGDLPGNGELIRKSVRRAEAAGASLVAFPELTLSGYPPEDLLLRRHFVADCGKLLAKLAADSGEIALVVGFPRAVGDALYNAAAVLHRGGIRGIYHKANLPNYGVFDEKRYFHSGDRCLVIELGGGRLGLHVCEDSWAPDSEPTPTLARAGLDAVLNVSASPYHRDKYDDRTRVLGEVARRCGAPLLYVNLVGAQDEVVFDGGSVAVSPGGVVLSRARCFEEELLFVDVEGRARRASADSGALDLVRLGDVGSDAALPPVPPALPGRETPVVEEDEIYRALVLGTSDYLRKNGFSRAVIGISGGIDSALVAALACDALGSENVIGVTMPSRFTSEGTRTDAGHLAEMLGMKLIELPIEKVVRAFGDVLARPFAGTEEGVAEENIQARARGTLLMALSNKFGWIVLNTGNKSETAVGYSTLYGDMAGALAVIGDVPKTMVYRLARWRNGRPAGPAIPESILTRPPSAELRAGQRDTDSLPEYEQLDAILEEFVERDLDTEAIAEKLGDPDMVRRVLRMVNRAEYKRRQAAPVIKITPKAFGRDRRLPITNRYRSAD